VDYLSDGRSFLSSQITAAVFSLLLAAVAIPSIGAVLETDEFANSREIILKDAGRWLDAYKGGEKTILGSSYIFMHYSQGTLIYLPHSPGSLALDYIRKKHPDFIVLDSKDSAPYIKEWMESGIPDPCAMEIKRCQQGDKQEISRKYLEVVIFEWVCPKQGDFKPFRAPLPAGLSPRVAYN
jgi:hypothetical protein